MSPPYERGESDECRVVDEWTSDDFAGVSWYAHPEESGKRTSHALQTAAGVWLLDPLDAPGIDDRITELGEVAGVVVLSDYHARDADVFAQRYDVPVTVPDWLARVEERVDAPVERVEDEFADFQFRRLKPMGVWHECVAYREADGTLYIPDGLSTHEKFTVGEERLGMATPWRLAPPRETFADIDPDRILTGHGDAITDDAGTALATAFDGARRRFPRALLFNFPNELGAMLGALR